MSAHPQSVTPEVVEPMLLEVADVVNTTLDLDTLLRRVAELVRRVIEYEIFAILLLNERTQELRIRFSVGHSQEVVDRTRIKLGEGVTGLAAQRGEAVLVNDTMNSEIYIESNPLVRAELAIPLITKNRVIGVIDIEAPQPGYFTEEHRRLLTLIASRIAIGIENARLYTRVSRQARTLTVLNEISRELTSILNLDELLKHVGELLTRLIDYQMFSILLLDESGTKLVHRFSLRFNENIHVKHDIPLGQGLVGHAAQHRQPIVVADVKHDARYIELNPETRSELCVPLIYKNKVIGVLDLEHTRAGYFTEAHLRTTTTLAAQVAIAIENARLYERVAQQERRLEKDLALAAELQFRLLPPCCPVLPQAQLAAKFVPARTIGGDLYDFINYSEDRETRVGVAIGDVSGKGAPAALYAALASGFLRSHAAGKPGPAQMLTAINASLSARPIAAQFVSMIYAVWDDRERVLRIANSGLPRPIYCHHGKVEQVETVGMPMGLFPVAEYDESTYHAQPGDMFVFFSDGILDAANRAGELFGRCRVEQVVARHCDSSADDLVTAVFRAVEEPAAGMEAFDDQTVLALKVTKGPSKKSG